MKTILALTAATLTFGAVTVEARQTLCNPNPTYTQPGQWHIAPNGCSYSRTKAPGEGEVWMLISNPHHIGGQNSRSGCARGGRVSMRVV